MFWKFHCKNRGPKNVKVAWKNSFLVFDRFILQDLDDVHLFVAADVAQQLQGKLDELMEQNSYNPLESEQKK